MTPHRRTGFGLGELAALIALLLLAAIVLFATLNGARPGGYSPCANNLKRLGNAITHYRTDHGPHLGLVDSDGPATGVDELRPLVGYIDDYSVLVCPATGNHLEIDPADPVSVAKLNAPAAATTSAEGKSYQSRGRLRDGTEITYDLMRERPETLWLFFENDRPGVDGKLDGADNHGEQGGNVLSGNMSVSWVRGDAWDIAKAKANR